MSLPGVVWLVERPRECRPRLTLRLVFVGHAIWPSSHDIPGKRQEEVSEPPVKVQWWKPSACIFPPSEIRRRKARGIFIKDRPARMQKQ